LILIGFAKNVGGTCTVNKRKGNMKTCEEVSGERISDVVTLDWCLWTQLVVSLSWFFASTSSPWSEVHRNWIWLDKWYKLEFKGNVSQFGEEVLPKSKWIYYCLSSMRKSSLDLGVWVASWAVRVRSKCMIWHVARLVRWA